MSDDNSYSGTKIFEGEATISQNAGHIQKILVLEKKERCIYEWVAYNSSREGSTEKHLRNKKVESNIKALLIDLTPVMIRKDEDIKQVNEMIEEKNYYDAITIISIFLDKIGLTKFDTRKEYDRTNVESENKEKEL